MTLRPRQADSSANKRAGESRLTAGPRARGSRAGRRVALVVLALGLVLAAATARLFIWPSLPQLPAHTDAIIELAGPGDRDTTTLALAREHRAPLVIQSTLASDALSDTCLPRIPGVTVECFHPTPATTRGEARYIGERGAVGHWKSVIIVTTPDHAWRARLRVERCFPGQVFVETSRLPTLDWLRQIPYQWAATVKAEVFQRGC